MGRRSNMGNSHTGLTDDGGEAQMDAIAALRGEFKDRKDAILSMYENDPASAATDPGHGLTTPQKGTAMDEPTDTTTTVPAASDALTADELVTAVFKVNEPLWRAQQLARLLAHMHAEELHQMMPWGGEQVFVVSEKIGTLLAFIANDLEDVLDGIMVVHEEAVTVARRRVA